MALWPFRRKSVRKRSRSGAALSDNEAAPVRSQADAALAKTASKKARTEPAKLQRRQRTYSFSPGRHDSILIDRARRNAEVASQPRPNSDGEHASGVAWKRTPTLHPTRRKSSKRRRDDHDREAEIKAMSAYMPARAAADAQARSNSKRGMKRAKTGGLDHGPAPASQVSLPYPDSVPSVMSADSDFISYKISALDSLAPRPTLKYTPSTRRTPSRGAAPGATDSLKKPLGGRQPIQEDELDSLKRMEDLANDLDAKDLRELMERDTRRRERRRQQDQERTARRLARRAERHRKDNAEAQKAGTPPPENLERGVLGRELVGLGIEPASTVVTSSKRRDVDTLPDAPTQIEDNVQPTKPLESFHRPETSPQDEASPQEQTPSTRPKIAEPPKPGSAFPQGSRLAGILRSKKSRSKSTLGSDKDQAADGESCRKNSEGSTKTGSRFSFSSLLKWGSRSQRYSGPSSFSNTSREEMHAGATTQNPAQAEALARLQGEDMSNSANYLAARSGAGVPKRTKSRFREDLPEFPISPPDSRVQSPEADSLLPVPAAKSHEMDSRPKPPSRHDTPSSIERPQNAQPVEPHQSTSLASIDSEGSWLSGRVGSMRTSVKRDSLMRSNRRGNAPSGSPTNSTQEDLAMTDDECLSRLVPDRNWGAIASGCRSGEGRASSDAGESVSTTDNVQWGSVGAKPEVVQFHSHNRETIRSQHVLLNIDSGDEEDDAMLTPSRPT
ncbi:uncharacterized protein MAM_08361 [Metarhizium album ARSEF 1941]|uniref:Uncharacterized protein n=1 Tax=Metarhizium album (strain ARSEF 1941) TaxID=1081103 RepID=A0A0B2WL86_METAS|nr:uncharacterized protein MAM_08361 [Metarhizium album ARSEF 1941]KHN93760.1 hypothetical protein MAM_08361 [Metarhizium album ARSEF 1941]